VYEELNADGTRELKKVRVSGTSEAETLASGARPSVQSLPVWSPDGRWILFDDDGIKLTPADGGPPRDLGVKDAVCTFARAPELLYCIEGLSSGPSKLVERGFDGSARVVGAVAREHLPQTSASPGLRLSLTPDGEGLTFGAGVLRVELLLGDGLDKIPLP
jgi:hypothetical protein